MGERERDDDLAYLIGIARATVTVLREFETDLAAIGPEKAKLAAHMRRALAHACQRVTRHAPPASPRKTGEWNPAELSRRARDPKK